MMDDLGLNMQVMQESGIFSGDEERFAFTRALSRLSEMGSMEWVERGMADEADEALERRVRSKWREDRM
jgi:protein AFG1